MKKITLLISLFIAFCSHAQDSTRKDSTVMFEKIEISAEFPGGQKAWKKYLADNLRVDEVMKKAARKKSKDWKQTAEVKFLVEKDGSVTDVWVVNAAQIHPEVVKESIRIIRASPKWIPAKQNGRVIRSYQTQTLIFCTSEE